MPQPPSRRLLIVVYEYPPLGGGGGHASAQIARRLASNGFDVTVLTSRHRGLPGIELRDGVRIRRIRVFRRHRERCSVWEMGIFLVASIVHAFILYRRHRYDAALSFFSIPSGPAALVLNRVFGVPYGVALRGADVPGFLPEQLRHFHRLTASLTRRIWRHADFVTANSEGLKKLAGDFLPGRSFTVIPNGVGGEFRHRRTEEEAGARDGGRVKLLTVGRLSLQKRIDRQIAALDGLVRTGLKDLRLEIAGDGPCRAELEGLASERGLLGEHVNFLGWLDRNDLPAVYRRADIFLQTSDYEGMANTLLEAMASSLAVVAVRAPGVDELIRDGENGIVVEKDRLGDLESALRNLAGDREKLSRLQANAFARAGQFTWDAAAELYRGLILGLPTGQAVTDGSPLGRTG